MAGYRSYFVGSGLVATLSLAAGTWRSVARVWSWAENLLAALFVVLMIVAALLAVLGVRAWLRVRPASLVVERASNAPLNDVALKVVRLKVINRGLPGRFNGRVRWIHNRQRMHHDPWDLCWVHTDERTTDVNDDRLVNVVIADHKSKMVRGVMPSFRELKTHQDQKPAFTDGVNIEIEIWRNGFKKPTRTGWRFVYYNEQISLERDDGSLPRQSTRRIAWFRSR